MNKPCVHLYWGEGKGKTTAAVGLAVRALGSGMKVTFVQFMKNGKSHELEMLRRLGARVVSGNERVKFFSQMDEAERAYVKLLHENNLSSAVETPCDLLVLDEACSAVKRGLLDEALLKRYLEKPAYEVVITGREPCPWMFDLADYSTEMRCHQHPYRQGIPAREGIEF